MAIDGKLVFPPTSRPYGLSYAEWSIRWWQWILSIPKDVNPGFDTKGTNCKRNQTWPVWFLVGTFEEFSYAVRSCTIPYDKAIMFPAIVSEKSFVEYPDVRKEEDLIRMVSETNERAKNVYVDIDGISLPDIDQFRFRSSPFNLHIPANNIFGVRAGATRSVSEGYWIILGPLARGAHRLRFGGQTYIKDTLEFRTDVKYHLTVE